MLANRLNNFDAIRIGAALLVIYGHAFPLSGMASPGIIGSSVQTLGVKIFFAISGFLIAKSWIKDPHVLRFLWKRVLRIFPALILVVVLTACVLGPLVTEVALGGYFSDPAFRNYFWNIALNIHYHLPATFANLKYPGAVNGSLWSLPAEFFMYLMTPLLLLAKRYKVLLGGIACVFAALGPWAMANLPATPIVYYGSNLWQWLDVIPFFIVGAWMATFRSDWKPNLQIGIAAFMALLLFKMPDMVQVTLFTFVLPYLVLAYAFASPPQFPQAARYGDISYGLYLYGFPMQQLTSMMIGPNPQSWQLFLYPLPAIVLLSFMSWHLVEKRALKLKDLVGRQKAPALEPKPAEV